MFCFFNRPDLHVLILDHIMDPLTAFCNSQIYVHYVRLFSYSEASFRCIVLSVLRVLELSSHLKLEKGTIDLLLQFFRMMSMKWVKEFLISDMSQTHSVIFFHGFSVNFRCVGPMLISLM